MARGTVKFFDGTRKFGFITSSECDQDIFVHQNEVDRPPLIEDQHVEFDIQYGSHGPKAKNVRVVPTNSVMENDDD